MFALGASTGGATLDAGKTLTVLADVGSVIRVQEKGTDPTPRPLTGTPYSDVPSGQSASWGPYPEVMYFGFFVLQGVKSHAGSYSTEFEAQTVSAAGVRVADTGEHFTEKNVEAILAEIGERLALLEA